MSLADVLMKCHSCHTSPVPVPQGQMTDDAFMSQLSDLTRAQFSHPGKDKDSEPQGYEASGTFSVLGLRIFTTSWEGGFI